MKWLTNSPKDRLNEDLAELGQKSRHLFSSRPKATEKHSVKELESWGMVGIYEA